jgi:hypothetical protein
MAAIPDKATPVCPALSCRLAESLQTALVAVAAAPQRGVIEHGDNLVKSNSRR